MAEKVIPLADHRYAVCRPDGAGHPACTDRTAGSTDWDRPLRDLRISVTDRCNFRCSYCMPKEVFDKRYDVPAAELVAELRGNHAACAACSSHTGCTRSD
ncbi:MAG: hypothetical protein V9G29_04690 [Burkholderiaceae bacterium]